MSNGSDGCNDVPLTAPTKRCGKCRGNGHIKVRIPDELLRGRTLYDHWDYYDFPECKDCGGTGKVLDL